MKETDCQKKFSFLQHSVTKRHAGPNLFSYFGHIMLGKIRVLRYYLRQVTTYHMIVLQLILLKTTEKRIFCNQIANKKP